MGGGRERGAGEEGRDWFSQLKFCVFNSIILNLKLSLLIGILHIYFIAYNIKELLNKHYHLVYCFRHVYIQAISVCNEFQNYVNINIINIKLFICRKLMQNRSQVNLFACSQVKQYSESHI